MNKRKAIKDLNKFRSVIQSYQTTGIRIKGNRNILVDAKAEGFDIGIEINGDQNIAIKTEAIGPNSDKTMEKYTYILGELDRDKTDVSRIRQLYEEIKSWSPTIAQIIINILTKNQVFK